MELYINIVYTMMEKQEIVQKTMNEKEPFVIKTAHKGKVKFSIISLEETEDANV